MIKFTNLEKPFDQLAKANALAKLHGTEINYELDRQGREQGFGSWDDLLQSLSMDDRETMELTRSAAVYDEKRLFFLKPDHGLTAKLSDAVTQDVTGENTGISVRLIKTVLRMNLETNCMKLDLPAEVIAACINFTAAIILIEILDALEQGRSPVMSKFLAAAASFQSADGKQSSEDFVSSLLFGGKATDRAVEPMPNSAFTGGQIAVFLQLALHLFADDDLKMAA